jgi:recombinational DNA repair protein RecR
MKIYIIVLFTFFATTKAYCQIENVYLQYNCGVCLGNKDFSIIIYKDQFSIESTNEKNIKIVVESKHITKNVYFSAKDFDVLKAKIKALDVVEIIEDFQTGTDGNHTILGFGDTFSTIEYKIFGFHIEDKSRFLKFKEIVLYILKAAEIDPKLIYG